MPEASGPPTVRHDMRRFVLDREVDVNGMSGVGVVAEGVAFSDGSVAMRWRTAWHTTELAADVATVQVLHGHQGCTRLVWVDG